MIWKSLIYSPKSGKFQNQTFFPVEAELKPLSDHTHPVTPSLTKIRFPPKKSHRQPSIDFPPPGKSRNIFIMHARVITRELSFFQQLQESSEERKGTGAFLQVPAFSSQLLQAACSKPLCGAQPGFLNLSRFRLVN